MWIEIDTLSTNIFNFDKTLNSFLPFYKEKILNIIAQYSSQFKVEGDKLSDIPTFFKHLKTDDNTKEIISYSLLKTLANSSIINHYLNEINEFNYSKIQNWSLKEELKRIYQQINNLKSFSEDIIETRHIIYGEGNGDYYGKATDNDLKHGFGCLILKNKTFWGTFTDDSFTSGFVLENKNSLFKGTFFKKNNINMFSGFHWLYTKSSDKLASSKAIKYFFGTINIDANSYTGCEFDFSKENVSKISYITDNREDLSIIYDDKNEIQVSFFDAGTKEIGLYSKNKYLIKKRDNWSTAVFLVQEDFIYSGGLIDIKENTVLNGYGTIWFENGDIYTGNFENNWKQGNGMFYNINDKVIYKGSYMWDGIVEGEIWDILQEKLVYKGWFNEVVNEDKNDKEKTIQKYSLKEGRYVYENNDEYIGGFSDNLRNGLGKYVYAGIAQSEENTVIECTWENGEKKGDCKINKYQKYTFIYKDNGELNKIYQNDLPKLTNEDE